MKNNLTKELEGKYNLVSKLYDILDFPFEILRYKKIRQTVWKQCTGKILDAGIGTGRNIPYYLKIIGLKSSFLFFISLSF